MSGLKEDPREDECRGEGVGVEDERARLGGNKNWYLLPRDQGSWVLRERKVESRVNLEVNKEEETEEAEGACTSG